MGCYLYFKQLGELNKGLESLLRAGLGPATKPYEELWKLRGEVMRKLGLRAVSKREVVRLLRLPGFSPGVVDVFFDIETGWIAQAYPESGATPIVRSITAEEAMNLLSPSPDPALVHRLMQPDTYVGE